jgi:hypothetical protein
LLRKVIVDDSDCDRCDPHADHDRFENSARVPPLTGSDAMLKASVRPWVPWRKHALRPHSKHDRESVRRRSADTMLEP